MKLGRVAVLLGAACIGVGVFIFGPPIPGSTARTIASLNTDGMRLVFRQKSNGYLDGYALRLFVRNRDEGQWDEFFVDYDSPYVWSGKIHPMNGAIVIQSNGFEIGRFLPREWVMEAPTGKRSGPIETHQSPSM